MEFFAQKVLRKVAGNWTFVVVTDRVELDDQIAKTFKVTGAVSEKLDSPELSQLKIHNQRTRFYRNDIGIRKT